MRKLTLSERFVPYQFRMVEEEFGFKVPDYLKECLKEYSNLGVKEKFFINSEGKVFSLCSFIDYKLMWDFLQEFRRDNLGKKIPFAIDDGGWVLVVSLDKETKGQVLLHQTEMEWNIPEEAFEKIADSFEDFVNGLKTKEQVF